MTKIFKRPDRVASELKKQLSLILQREVDSNKLGLISVTNVTISPDLAYAKVFLTFLDIGSSNNLTPEQKIKELKKRTPYFRSLLGKALLLRIVPELVFVYDNSLDIQDSMNRLLYSLK